MYERVTDSPEEIAKIRANYAALVAACDHYFGKLLDYFDRHALWRDTALFLSTDHGLLLAEHDWWGKNLQPYYIEISHIPCIGITRCTRPRRRAAPVAHLNHGPDAHVPRDFRPPRAGRGASARCTNDKHRRRRNERYPVRLDRARGGCRLDVLGFSRSACTTGLCRGNPRLHLQLERTLDRASHLARHGNRSGGHRALCSAVRNPAWSDGCGFGHRDASGAAADGDRATLHRARADGRRAVK